MAKFLLFEISQLLANFVSGRTDFPLENRHDHLAQTLPIIKEQSINICSLFRLIFGQDALLVYIYT